MREADLEERLQLTRKVFKGQLSRVGLAQKSSLDVAFVGTAIMLAVRRGFVNAHNVVQGAYSRILGRLMLDGVADVSAGDVEGTKSGAMLMEAARRMELYRSYPPGRGRGKVIVLTPPPELVALVQEYGFASAIHVFLQEARQGVALRGTQRRSIVEL